MKLSIPQSMILILKLVLEEMVVVHHGFASWIIKQFFGEKKNRLKYVEFSAIEKIWDCILSQLYSVITKLPERLILNILILKYTDLSFLHSRKTRISLSQIPLL